MHLQKEGDTYQVTFERADRRPVTEACRELIWMIATNDHINGERVYTGDDARTLMGLAKIAVHANTEKNVALPLNAHELHDFETALRIFSTIETAKKAIEAEAQRAGLLSNPRIEARIDLGQKVAAILSDLRGQKEHLDHHAAA